MNLNSEQLRDSFGSPTSRCLYWGNPREEILFVFFEARDARDTLSILQGDAQLETTLTVPGKAHFSWKGNSHPHKTTRLFCFSSIKSKSSVAKLTEEVNRHGVLVSFQQKQLCTDGQEGVPHSRQQVVCPQCPWLCGQRSRPLSPRD